MTPEEERAALLEVVAMQAALIDKLQADNLAMARYIKRGQSWTEAMEAMRRIFSK